MINKTAYAVPENGDFYIWILRCIYYQTVTKKLLYKFCLGSTKYNFQLVDYKRFAQQCAEFLTANGKHVNKFRYVCVYFTSGCSLMLYWWS